MHHPRRMSTALALTTLALASGAVAASVADAAAHTSDATAHTSAAVASVSVRTTKYGKILVDSKGRTLYLWAKDKHPNKTVCSDACEAVWPLAFMIGKPTAGPGVSASMLGSIPVTDSTTKRELTYNGHPLYRFVSDVNPGQVTGQGNTTFGAPWWLVSPNGTAITKK